MQAGSMHTLTAIEELYRLPQAQQNEFRKRLSGKATYLDDDGIAWYRYCDISHALSDLAVVENAIR